LRAGRGEGQGTKQQGKQEGTHEKEKATGWENNKRENQVVRMSGGTGYK
jgi:hypothetical protein